MIRHFKPNWQLGLDRDGNSMGNGLEGEVLSAQDLFRCLHACQVHIQTLICLHWLTRMLACLHIWVAAATVVPAHPPALMKARLGKKIPKAKSSSSRQSIQTRNYTSPLATRTWKGSFVPSVVCGFNDTFAPSSLKHIPQLVTNHSMFFISVFWLVGNVSEKY